MLCYCRQPFDAVDNCKLYFIAIIYYIICIVMSSLIDIFHFYLHNLLFSTKYWASTLSNSSTQNTSMIKFKTG